MKQIICIFLSVFAFTACEILDGGSQEIELTGGTPTTQTVYADETSKTECIKFTASAEWYAEVENAAGKEGGSNIDWLSLSQYSGGEGNFTLDLTLLTNTTGRDRKAAISITCGEAIITVTVEQRATTEGGEVPSSADTYDGEEPYVRFETEEIILPAAQTEFFEVALQTNMIEPAIQIIPAVEGENIAGARELTIPDMGNGGECRLVLEVFPNGEDRLRTADLQFQVPNSGAVIRSIVLKQQPAAVCQVLEKHAEVGRLSFKIKASAQVRYVSYGLSDKPLNQEEINEFFGSPDPDKIIQLELQGEGEKTFEAVIDNLLPATTYYLYLRPETVAGEGGGVMLTEEAVTAAQESKHDLILEVSANPANGFTVCLPFCDDELDGTIDWGDGTTEEVKGWNLSGVSHKYAVGSATTFQVRFSGVLTTIQLVDDNRPARENTLIAVKQWGYTGLTQIDLSYFTSLREIAPDTEGAFRGMEHFGVEPYGGSFSGTGIETIPSGFFDYAVGAASFDDTFGGCDRLKSIPDGLFRNCTKATSFSRTFIECRLIEQIPEDLFATCTEATSFWATFAYCEALRGIPAGLFANNPKVVSFEGTFGDCKSLTQIPGELFAGCPEVIYFGMSKIRDDTHRGGLGVFEKCVSLTSVPENLFAGNPDVKDFSYAFGGCSALTALPRGLFDHNAKLEYLEGTFYNCESLTSIPAAIFDNNRMLTNVELLFSQCYGLKGESPFTLINGNKVHLYERINYNTEFVAIDWYYNCFNGCTALTDYAAIEEAW